MLPHAETTESILGRKWRLKYNRSHDREFASAKMDRLSGGRMTYTPMREGLESCLRTFLEGDRRFRRLSAKSEAYMDRLTKSHTPLSAFPSLKDKTKYCVGMYTPYFAIMERRMK